MLRSAASKVMWVGRATVFLIGLAVILALVLGAATAALGATGQALILGKANNTAETTTGLVGTLADATKSALLISNRSGGPALDLRVGNATTPARDVAPMKVNSDKVVTNLNAGKLDGLDSTTLMRSSTYVKTESLPIADGVSNSTVLYCSSPSDRVLGGGFSKQPTVEVTSSTPYVNPSDSGGQGWGMSATDRTSGDGGASVTVHVLCADFPPAHAS